MSTATQPRTVSRKAREQQLHAAAKDPAVFRSAIMIDAGSGIVPLNSVIEPWQRADFEATDPAWRRLVWRNVPEAKNHAWLERPRGHSKTTDIAIQVCYALFASPTYLSGVVAAADRDQAALIRNAAAKLVQLNPWLGDYIEVQNWRIVNKRTDAECEILSSDVKSSYGLLCDFVICDELTHWPKRELWDSLLSTAAKREHCLLQVITNAGWETSWQFPLREAVRDNPSWHFSHLLGPQASWITEVTLAEQRALLPPMVYLRLWGNVWTEGEGDAITPDDLTAACTLTGPTPQGEPGWVYVAAVDIGLKRDATAIAVIGKHVGRVIDEPAEVSAPPAGPRSALEDLGFFEKSLPNHQGVVKYEEGTGLLRLAELEVYKPTPGTPVEIAAIEAAIQKLNSRFRFAAVACDPWQARYLIERLNAVGIPTTPVDFTGPALKSMADATLSAFTDRRLAIYPDPTLLADLRALRVVEKSYGIRLESPRNSTGDGTKHGDAATGLAIGLHAIRSIVASVAARVVNRPLICYP